MQNDRLLGEILRVDRLLGAVKHRSVWRYIAATLGEWTLDYPACDPGHRRSSNDSFRGGLIRVDESNADEFCEVMRSYQPEKSDIVRWVKAHGVRKVPLLMVANFDERTFVHGYNEPVEPKSDYIPDHWEGIEGNPLDYVPTEVAAPWRILPDHDVVDSERSED